jgi:hypothetical protein
MQNGAVISCSRLYSMLISRGQATTRWPSTITSRACRFGRCCSQSTIGGCVTLLRRKLLSDCVAGCSLRCIATLRLPTTITPAPRVSRKRTRSVGPSGVTQLHCRSHSSVLCVWLFAHMHAAADRCGGVSLPESCWSHTGTHAILGDQNAARRSAASRCGVTTN